MKIKIEIDDKDIIRDINREYYQKLRPHWDLACVKVLPGIKRICYDAIISSPEYQNATPGGYLYHELGIPDIEVRLQAVIVEVINNIYVKYKLERRTDDLFGIFEIGILKSDYSDILGLPTSVFDYYSTKQNRDIVLPWLEWLLLDGSKPIVLGYHFALVNKPQSRTGLGLMFANGSWSMDPRFAGTQRNNFLTRSIRAIQDELQNYIEKEFENTLNTKF